MKSREAVQVMRALAGGVDPETSQPVAMLKPQLVKALNRAPGALMQQQERERNKPSNAGKHWSHDEEAKV